MKSHFSDLTPEQQSSFGNGCTFAPDFIFTANCRQHDFNYCRGTYLRLVWSDYISSKFPILGRLVRRLVNAIEFIYRGLRAKIKADYDMCVRMFDNACESRHPVMYGLLAVFYYLGLTFLPISYFLFTWGRYRTLNEIIERDMISKTLI